MIKTYDEIKSEDGIGFGDTLRQVQDFKNQYDEHGLANVIHR
jgi:phage gp37-like protein